MDTLKIKTLDQVHDALDVVEEARADDTITHAEKLKLEKAAVKLRNLERSIIKLVQKDLVASLAADTKDLKDLSLQMKASSEKLAAVSAAIGKAASVVEAFIKIITSVVAAGLL